MTGSRTLKIDSERVQREIIMNSYKGEMKMIYVTICDMSSWTHHEFKIPAGSYGEKILADKITKLGYVKCLRKEATMYVSFNVIDGVAYDRKSWWIKPIQ